MRTSSVTEPGPARRRRKASFAAVPVLGEDVAKEAAPGPPLHRPAIAEDRVEAFRAVEIAGRGVELPRAEIAGLQRQGEQGFVAVPPSGRRGLGRAADGFSGKRHPAGASRCRGQRLGEGRDSMARAPTKAMISASAKPPRLSAMPVFELKPLAAAAGGEGREAGS